MHKPPSQWRGGIERWATLLINNPTVHVGIHHVHGVAGIHSNNDIAYAIFRPHDNFSTTKNVRWTIILHSGDKELIF